MFKYISEILKQFSSTQKLLVLVILLISILSVTYINSVTKTPEELTKTISLQRAQIIDEQNQLFEKSIKINALNDSIMKQNQSCNEKAIEVGNYYNEKLINQQKYVTAKIEELENMLNNNRNKVVLKSMMIDSLTINENNQTKIVSEIDNVDEIIMKKLKTIKKKINNNQSN